VGGHCIPKDSWLLAAPLGDGAEDSLLGVARRINDGMPAHVAELVSELIGPGRHARVAVLGFAYLENSDDTRNSPSAELVRLLSKRGFEVAVHDPFVQEHKGDVMDVLRNADCAVLMVAHAAYRELDLSTAARVMRSRAVVDARGFFGAEALGQAGFDHRVIGVGKRAATYTGAAEPK
jgi:UDP-N-acetyl-D-mannosaminuronic acid dehydrogenase